MYLTIMDGNDYGIKGNFYWWKIDLKRKVTGNLKHSGAIVGDKESVGFRPSLRICFSQGVRGSSTGSLLAWALGPARTSEILPLSPGSYVGVQSSVCTYQGHSRHSVMIIISVCHNMVSCYLWPCP